MKNPNELKELVSFQLYEIDSIKEYLEDMALKGWKLKYVKTFYYFEKIEPQKLYYSVDIFINASIYDTIPPVNATMYYDKFVQAGWELLCNAGQLYFFVTDKENVTPIQPDQHLKFKTIKKAIIKKYALSWFCILPLFLISLFLELINFESLVTSNIDLILFIFRLIAIIIFIKTLCDFVFFNLKQSAKLKHGKPISFFANITIKNIKLRYYIMLAIFNILLFSITFSGIILNNIFLICISIFNFFIVIIVLFFSCYVEKQKFSSKKNKVLIVLLGVAISILGSIFALVVLFIIEEEPLPDNVSYFSETFLASTTTYELVLKDGSEISVDVFKSKYDFIINRYLNSKALINNLNGSSYDVSLPEWDAQFTYSSDYKYVIVYKDCVISFNNNLELSEEEFEQIKALKN